MTASPEAENAVIRRRRQQTLKRLHDDYPLYGRECLRIKAKSGQLVPLILNRAQQYVHARLEKQKAETGMVRALILKGRQAGFSTYIGGRFYHATSLNRGIETFILTHDQDATDNLFAMVERFHQHTPLRPSTSASNAKELKFDKLDGGYSVGTAGATAVGRSKTIHRLHGSEVAFWKNARDHFAGVVQTVPNEPGTEIILESTGHGPSGEFYERWQQAEAGIGDYIAIFVPWFWTPEYRRPVVPGFSLDEEETKYAEAHKLDLEQMAWRRAKIAELKDPILFKQEYPATATEAFEFTGHDGFISAEVVLAARKATREGIGPLVVGVDPARFGNDRFSVAWRQGRKVHKVESRTNLGTVQAIGWLQDIIDHDRPRRVFIDTGGGGDRIYDMLCSYGDHYAKVLRLVAFGGSPQQPVRVIPDKERAHGIKRAGPKNRRAEMWQRLKDWLEQVGGADIPDSDLLQADICAPGYSYDAVTQQLILESKEHMRDVRKVRSPDEGDAVALTFAEPVNESMDDRDAPRLPEWETRDPGLGMLG